MTTQSMAEEGDLVADPGVDRPLLGTGPDPLAPRAGAGQTVVSMLARLGSVRDGIVVVVALVYVVGYLEWAYYAWRHHLGPLPVLREQYLIAGLLPLLAIVGATGAIFGVVRARQRLALSRACPRPAEVLLAVCLTSAVDIPLCLAEGPLGLSTDSMSMMVAMNLTSVCLWLQIIMSVEDDGTPFCPGLSAWMVGMGVLAGDGAAALALRLGLFDPAQGGVWGSLIAFLTIDAAACFCLIPGISLTAQRLLSFENPTLVVITALVAVELAALQLSTQAFARMPAEFGGPVPRAARLDVVTDGISDSELSRLRYEGTPGDERCVLTSPVWVLFQAPGNLLVRPACRGTASGGPPISIPKESVRSVDWLGGVWLK